MKVVLFAPSRSTHTHKWVLGLKKKGLDVSVISFANHYSKEHAEKVETYSLPKYLPGKLSYLTTIFALRNLLSKIKPDLVHAHYASSYGLVASLARIHPIIISVWGSDVYQFPRKPLNKRILSYALSSADVLCSTSKAMLKETQKYTNKPIELTPFGVDTTHFTPNKKQKPTKEEFIIGIAKGLKDIYGFPKLFQAIARLTETEKKVRLLVIGDGPEKAKYQQMVSELGIAEIVTFVGQVANDEMPKWLNQMDLFVLPSESESFGVAALEAEACGIPVIVNDVGGLPEVVIHQKTGLIIPNNEPEEIYQAIKSLLYDNETRSMMGEHAVQFVKDNYDWEMCLQQMIELYEACLNIVR